MVPATRGHDKKHRGLSRRHEKLHGGMEIWLHGVNDNVELVRLFKFKKEDQTYIWLREQKQLVFRYYCTYSLSFEVAFKKLIILFAYDIAIIILFFSAHMSNSNNLMNF